MPIDPGCTFIMSNVFETALGESSSAYWLLNMSSRAARIGGMGDRRAGRMRAVAMVVTGYFHALATSFSSSGSTATVKLTCLWKGTGHTWQPTPCPSYSVRLNGLHCPKYRRAACSMLLMVDSTNWVPKVVRTSSHSTLTIWCQIQGSLAIEVALHCSPSRVEQLNKEQ